MIIIADTKVARRIGEYFVKQIQKLQEVHNALFPKESQTLEIFLQSSIQMNIYCR